MPNYPYDDELTPDVTPEQLPEEPDSTPESGDFAEEFDISSFDFTIADPGEIAEYSETIGGSEDLAPEEDFLEDQESAEILDSAPGKKPKFSFRELSATVTEKITKLMEETPKEPKVRLPKKKKEKEQEPAAEPEFSEGKTKHPRQPLPLSEEPGDEKVRFTGGTFRQVSKRWLRYALRPGTLCENVSEKLWPLFLAGVMAFFGGFYLLLGLDWYFAGLVSAGRLWAVVGVGLLVGGTAAMAFAAGTLALSLSCRKERLRPFRIISGVAGACVYPAGLMIFGLLVQLIFHASVSMSFGIMALLWFFYLLVDVLRDLFGEKHLFKSTVLLVVWGFFLFLVMTWTFTLK